MDQNHPLIEFLFSRHRFGLKPGLDRINALLSFLGNPEQSFAVVHVAGTNGKGSTCAYLESLYRSTGLRTGLYTSPHLVKPEERIRVNFEKIPREALLDLIGGLKSRIERTGATFFEAMTAIAFAYFAERRVDVAVVEVGLGGRWDATNVVTPLATVITDVHLDHQLHLGRSVGEIAREKAGIIKAGAPCFTYVRSRSALAAITAHAIERGTEVHRLQKEGRVRVTGLSSKGTDFTYRGGYHLRGLHTELVGRHQARNAGLALMVFEQSNMGRSANKRAMTRAILETRWAGRFQIVSEQPLRVLDVAHNTQAVRAFVDTFRALWPETRDAVVVFGVLRDKPFGRMFRDLRLVASTAVVCRLPSLRSADADALEKAARNAGFEVHRAPTPVDAWRLGEKLAAERPLLAIGSHYLVGAVMEDMDLTPP